MSNSFVRSACITCAGTGWVNTIKNHLPYVFRCGACPAAQNLNLSLNIPAWTPQKKNEFELYTNYMARESWKQSPEKKISTEVGGA